MDDKKLGDLVKKAKGERSIRRYAKESDVDAAVISKIINGTYVPKKTEVYEKLTSPAAAPRGGVNYRQLVEAANSSKSYQAGIRAGIAAAGAAAAMTVAGAPMAVVGGGIATATLLSSATKKMKKQCDITETYDEIQRFVALTNGLIYAGMAKKGISFQILDERYPELVNMFDTYLKLQNQPVCEYLLRYCYLTMEYQESGFALENTPRRLFEELAFLTPSNTRKVTIITNCEKSYEYMIERKDKMSLNAEVSMLLVDVKKAELLKEDYISHYIGENVPEAFSLL